MFAEDVDVEREDAAMDPVAVGFWDGDGEVAGADGEEPCWDWSAPRRPRGRMMGVFFSWLDVVNII